MTENIMEYIRQGHHDISLLLPSFITINQTFRPHHQFLLPQLAIPPGLLKCRKVQVFMSTMLSFTHLDNSIISDVNIHSYIKLSILIILFLILIQLFIISRQLATDLRPPLIPTSPS